MRFTIGNVQVEVSVRRVVWVKGFISKLDDGRHILMWDFDGVSENEVRMAIGEAITRWILPDVLVWSTGRPYSYHAVCLEPYEFNDALAIVATTRYVDRWYIALSAIRGYFTLRYSAKGNESNRKAFWVYGVGKPSLRLSDISRGVRYPTAKITPNEKGGE
jgi:hypothetical protein